LNKVCLKVGEGLPSLVVVLEKSLVVWVVARLAKGARIVVPTAGSSPAACDGGSGGISDLSWW